MISSEREQRAVCDVTRKAAQRAISLLSWGPCCQKQRFSQTVKIRGQSDRLLLPSLLSYRARYIFRPRLICHTSMTLEAQNGVISFAWLLARVAGDFWTVHWQRFIQLKANVLSFCPQEETRLQSSVFMSLCVENTSTQSGIKIVHLVSLYTYHHLWTYQLEQYFSYQKKFPIDQHICHESHTPTAPITIKINTLTPACLWGVILLTIVSSLQWTAILFIGSWGSPERLELF